MRIWLSPPFVGDAERAAVDSAISQGWVAPVGPDLNGFEADLSRLVNDAHVACVSSGTAAIHLALRLLDVGPGDRVLVSTFTFAASANPILYCGGVPVFVESERASWNMSPAYLHEAIVRSIAEGARPKACIIVDLYGMPADYDALHALCEHYEIPIIEDSAEALGASYRGRPCGTFGAFGIFSFNGNKIITTSGGGALVTHNPAHAARARFLATQARDPAPHYQHSTVGYNYRLSNVLAALGRAQLERLPFKVAKRREIFERYREMLSPAGIEFMPEPDGSLGNRWLTTIVFPPTHFAPATRETVRRALEARGIESRPLWKPLHAQPVFGDCPYFGDGLSERLFDAGLCLPSGEALTDQDLEEIGGTVRAAITGAARKLSA